MTARQLIYAETRSVANYLTQLGMRGSRKLTKSTSSLALPLRWLDLNFSREYTYDYSPTFDDLDRLIQRLDELGQLSSERPITFSTPDPLCPFVLEVCEARKVILKKEHIEPIPGLREMALWISDPDPKDISDKQWDFRGSFLILTQLHFDSGDLTTVYSGCSALQAVVNAFEGQELLRRVGKEPLGRDSYLHPVEKLAAFGATVAPPQKIRTLYRLRYMSDEQCYTLNGRECRVHNLLAYPLFIEGMW